MLSLHRLQHRRPLNHNGPPVPLDIQEWRATTTSLLAGQPLGRAVRDHALPLLPLAAYFPDFLTPHTATAGFDELESGIDDVLSTPKTRISDELGLLSTRSPAPGWGADLASGRTDALRTLSRTLRTYYSTAVAPHRRSIHRTVAAESARLSGIRTELGIDAMLAGLPPPSIWHQAERVLESAYPFDADVHLDGRGMILVPSWFCYNMPVKLADPGLPPVLVYPIPREPPRPPDPEALAKLIGRTRAQILLAVTHGTSTAEIQRRTGVSGAQLSRHAAVLRDNDLIVEARHAGRVYYSRGPLADDLTSQPPGT
ncbi:winged helix-turn-helix domain-containing protein [Pseudonocardia sp. TRM90224]|uniref:winged helix-turn-helix domain-containing protein n=1 Tax=Pseudonocardia sp. TRM90224 TaxID=2812678 RepID=UPI001E53ABD6|nr:winged helix-turn-helix domain-containing protein [Pseudonocardia sp. TRM90224]